ncbi:MAG: cytochrome C oxidase subunit IV family protein [bacterium]|nr:cytochrome C oxidase subunit IV family protein [bacterium]
MATDTTEIEAVDAGRADHGEDHIEHPSPAQYWLIALILAIITAVEIGASYISALEGPLLVSILLILGGVKFAMVVALFMHLKFDKPLYRNFFLIGLFGALAMFVVVLLTFRAL